MANPSRAAATRAALARPAIGGEAPPRLWLDPSKLDPNFDYTWIRESTLGEYDEGNIQTAMSQQGYVPVEADEMPEAVAPTLPGRKAAGDKLIRRGGQILMKRSKEIAQDHAKALAEANRAAIAGVTKDLAGGMDGKNFQPLPDGGVQTAVDRGSSPTAQERFAE